MHTQLIGALLQEGFGGGLLRLAVEVGRCLPVVCPVMSAVFRTDVCSINTGNHS